MKYILLLILFPVFVFSQTFGRNDTTFTIKKIGSWNDKNEIDLIVDGCIEHEVVITILPMDFKILQLCFIEDKLVFVKEDEYKKLDFDSLKKLVLCKQ
jgi:hypothetical protein